MIVREHPVVIEPTAVAIELQASGDRGAVFWTQWPRIPVEQVAAVTTLHDGAIHWFGQFSELAKCELALGYQATGLLRMVISKYDGEWVAQSLSPESTGQADERPYVRLVFENARARDAFLRYLHLVDLGSAHNPSISLMLKQLVVPPIVGLQAVMKDKPDG